MIDGARRTVPAFTQGPIKSPNCFTKPFIHLLSADLLIYEALPSKSTKRLGRPVPTKSLQRTGVDLYFFGLYQELALLARKSGQDGLL